MSSKIINRYAKALFQSANKSEQKHFLDNFKDLLSLYATIPKLSSFLNSPEIDKQHKENIFKISFKDNPMFVDFLSLLLEKGRFEYVQDIAQEYRNIYATSYGISQAHFTSAAPVDEEIKEKLRKKLNSIYNTQFELTYDVDPQCIGGGILIIANRMIDFSIEDKLNKLHANLLRH